MSESDSILSRRIFVKMGVATVAGLAIVPSNMNGRNVSNTIRMLNYDADLPNKLYKPSEYSGLGRVLLEKNMVNGVNILTQSMIKTANTMYIIEYDFDLKNASLTIPSGCVLKFEGGSLRNGTLEFNSISIDAGYYKIFTNITYSGKVLNPINILWFGAVGDGVTNCDDAFAKAFRSNSKDVFENTVFVPHGRYLTTKTIYVRKGCKLLGENATSTDIYYTGAGEVARAIVMGENENSADAGGHIPVISDISILCPNGGRGIYVTQSGWKVENCWFTCSVGIEASGTDGVISKCVADQGHVFVRLRNVGSPTSFYNRSHSIIISDCISYACAYSAIYASGSYGVIISNCFFYYSKRYSILVDKECGGFIISNCEFRTSADAHYYTSDNTHIFTSNTGKLTDSTICNCKFALSRRADININCTRVGISDCFFRDSFGYSIYLPAGLYNKISGCMFEAIANVPIYNLSKTVISDNQFINIKYKSVTSYLNVCIINQNLGAAGSYVHDNICFGSIPVTSFISGATRGHSSNNISESGTIDVIDFTNSLTSYNERKQ